MKEIDARGLACPEPVLKTKTALEQAAEGDRLRVLVDNKAARDNVLRFAQSAGNSAHVALDEDDKIEIEITRVGRETQNPEQEGGSVPPVFFIGSDTVGRGNDELGGILTGAMLGALAETSPAPSALVFMNTGVKLAVDDSAVLDKIRKLEELGIQILVCGTCLDYFGLKDRLAVGRVSNMFSILETFLKAGSVIAP